MNNPTREDLVLQAAAELLIPSNEVTNLEIKNKLIAEYSQFHWTQNFIHTTMDNFYQQGIFFIARMNTAPNGEEYRTYSSYNWVPQVAITVVDVNTVPALDSFTKTVDPNTASNTDSNSTPTTRVSIDKSKALQFIQNNRGHFFTVLYKEPNGSLKTFSCQYAKEQPNLNVNIIKVKESIKLRLTPENPFINLHIDNIKELNINKGLYSIV